MAQQGSKKSRVLIWTIVGILVVVAAILTITGRRSREGTAKRVIRVEQIPQLVGNMTRKIDAAERNFARKRDQVTPEAFAQAAEYLAKARTNLQEFQGLTDPKELDAKMEEAKANLGAARKLFKADPGDEKEE
jgi:hypothetical protein